MTVGPVIGPDRGEPWWPSDPPRADVPRGALDYCFGAAGDERTMHRNVAALDRYSFIPRMLRGADVSARVRVSGGEIAAPILVAPMGLQALLHPDAEAATAAAAAQVGVGHCLSTFSSLSPAEVVGRAGPGLRWFQLYILTDPGLTAELLAEAVSLGFAAIVCTLDVPVVGRRTRDASNSFDRFAAAPPALVRTRRFTELVAAAGASPRAMLDQVFPNPACSWDDIAALIASTELPVLLKGILHPADALRAVQLGAAGIIVSNHGGRQLDRSVTSAEALPRVCDAVGDAVPVYLDSGVRDGRHVAVAIGLGARAVLVGRPVLAALAAGGQERVAVRLRALADQLIHVMRLVGAAAPAELGRAELMAPRGCEGCQRPGDRGRWEEFP